MTTDNDHTGAIAAEIITRLDELRELVRAIWDKLTRIEDELALRPNRADDQS